MKDFFEWFFNADDSVLAYTIITVLSIGLMFGIAIIDNMPLQWMYLIVPNAFITLVIVLYYLIKIKKW